MAREVGSPATEPGLSLERLPLQHVLVPEQPRKRINEGDDLIFFLQSRAFVDIVTFLSQLDRALFPLKHVDGAVQPWSTQSVHITLSPQVMRIKVLVQTLATIHKETPPETGPRRFGNTAFRTWYRKVEERLPVLLQQALPENVWNHVTKTNQALLKTELSGYLLESFGSPERLDYGTGHELSFMTFIGALWKLNGFAPSEAGAEERGIVVGIIDPYLELIRKMIKTYSLEPAGSHGVWGLDDHSFVPYIFGSAQLSPAVATDSNIPTEGSYPNAPSPAVVTNEQQVRALSNSCLYFAAVAFIYDVKKGPFWEHSPTLYDISGIPAGWAKINKGLMKMYVAEVLSKFPVIQHLRFGSLFRWEQDPRAVAPTATMHTMSQHLPGQSGLVGRRPPGSDPVTVRSSQGGAGTVAPWVTDTATRTATANTGRPGSSHGRNAGGSTPRSRPHVFGDHATSTNSSANNSPTLDPRGANRNVPTWTTRPRSVLPASEPGMAVGDEAAMSDMAPPQPTI